MTERQETVVTTISTDTPGGGRYLARISEGTVDIQVRTIETYASLLMPLEDLEGFAAFMDVVRADPAAAVAESEPSPAPSPEPTPEEEATNG